MFGFNKQQNQGERGEVLPETNEGAPDSHRPSGLCPRCNKQSSFDVIGSIPVTFDSTYSVGRDGSQVPGVLDRVSSLLCRHCNHGVVVIEEQWVGEMSEKERRKAKATDTLRPIPAPPGRNETFSGGLLSYRGVHWWPLPSATVSSDVPTGIAEAYAEASLCLAANCPRASVVMARRTLEAVCADKGQDKGNLAARLSALSASGVLHPSLTEWVKEVRVIGNTGAHYDPMEQASPDDARQLLNFLRELLRYLYEMPAELNRRRATP